MTLQFPTCRKTVAILASLFVATLSLNVCQAGKLYVGSSSISITPEERVMLAGQFSTRLASHTESECIATAIAIETRDGDTSLEQSIFVSCDLVGLYGPPHFPDEVRTKLKGKLPDQMLPHIVLNATHTHTAPVMIEGHYTLPADAGGAMTPAEYREFLIDRLAEVIVKAWEKRAPAQVAWGHGYGVVAHNRRSVFANGTSIMYGNTNDVNFRGTEGTEDHGIEILYFWNEQNKLIATAINVACPSQEVESRTAVNADFWHQVREGIHKKHGNQVDVLALTGAGGDQSPHLMYRKAAEERMQRLRGVSSIEDIAHRIVDVWEDVLQVVQVERHDHIAFEHFTETIQLPYRKITKLQADAAQAAYDQIKDQPQYWAHDWNLDVVKRFNAQQQTEQPLYDMELHVVRLGDIAITTNPFELFTDYGVQMKSRSPALQTFVVQLAAGCGGYLPSERGANGGGYSAIPQSTPIGPDGGQVLVDQTVNALLKLWEPKQTSAQ